jgi:hypothetical protein
MGRKAGRALLVFAAVAIVIGVGVGIGVAVINSGLIPQQVALAPTPLPSPFATSKASLAPASPVTATPVPSGVAVGGPLQMPVGDDCLACHTTPGGGVGTVAIPPIGHPREGWESCTSCHANNRLVATAPGHSGIHADQCLLCHTATTPAAVDRPHSLDKNAQCLSCHGSLAPLPDSMKGRSEATCFLCHQGTANVIPGYPHPAPADGACLRCHVSGEVGALPADHAGRTNNQCNACHSPSSTQPPVSPHDLKSYEGMCEFCHGSRSQQD